MNEKKHRGLKILVKIHISQNRGSFSQNFSDFFITVRRGWKIQGQFKRPPGYAFTKSKSKPILVQKDKGSHSHISLSVNHNVLELISRDIRNKYIHFGRSNRTFFFFFFCPFVSNTDTIFINIEYPPPPPTTFFPCDRRRPFSGIQPTMEIVFETRTSCTGVHLHVLTGCRRA